MPATPKRLLTFCTEHGGADKSAMFPNQSTISEEMEVYPGHTVRRGDLSLAVDGGTASLCEILSAPSDVLTDQLASKMNVMCGLDIPFYIAHHVGGFLGNYAENDTKTLGDVDMPTIDQIVAHSPGFYGDDLNGVVARSIAIGQRRGYSTGYSTPGDSSSNLVAQYTYRAQEAFNALFPNAGAQSSGDAPRPSIVDRVIENYRTLRQSNRRLSSEDRQRLDDHVAQLHELDRRLNVTLSCDVPPDGPAGDGMDAMLEVVAMALLCGSTRIVTYSPIEYGYVSFSGNWHQDVAHQHESPEPQQLIREAYQLFFERQVLRMAQLLDVEDVPGSTVLDNSLVMWVQEAGWKTHHAFNLPVVTFGSAGGELRTGQFCDYRNLDVTVPNRDPGHQWGLFYSQYLANVMRAMGVTQAEWSAVPRNADAGYGFFKMDSDLRDRGAYVDGVASGANDWLPWLRA